MEMVLDLQQISERRRLQISMDRKPIRRASIVIAALLSCEAVLHLSAKSLMDSSCSLDRVVTMEVRGAFSVAKASSSVSGISLLDARNLTNVRTARM